MKGLENMPYSKRLQNVNVFSSSKGKVKERCNYSLKNIYVEHKLDNVLFSLVETDIPMDSHAWELKLEQTRNKEHIIIWVNNNLPRIVVIFFISLWAKIRCLPKICSVGKLRLINGSPMDCVTQESD